MIVGINQKVKARLTDFGRKILREQWESLQEYYASLPEYVPITEDDEGWSEWQLWELMEQFGPHINFGNVEQPIIDIKVEQ